jgi:hypothetical protein
MEPNEPPIEQPTEQPTEPRIEQTIEPPTETPIKMEQYETHGFSTIARTPPKIVEPVKINPEDVTVDEFYEIAEYLCRTGNLEILKGIFMKNKHMPVTEKMFAIALKKRHVDLSMWLHNFEKAQKEGLFKEKYKIIYSRPYKPYYPPINHTKPPFPFK